MAIAVKQKHLNNFISVKEYKGKLGEAPAETVKVLAEKYKELEKFFEEKSDEVSAKKEKAVAQVTEPVK